MTSLNLGDCVVLAELLYGPDNTGSQFATREELRAAWLAHRTECMALWTQIGRRCLGWWEFECPPGLKFDYDRERSDLWRAGILSADERAELELEWHQAFEWAHSQGFDAIRRRRHFDWADIPRELRKRWRAQRRRSARGEAVQDLASPAAPVPRG
jgi:hypothetical protein